MIRACVRSAADGNCSAEPAAWMNWRVAGCSGSSSRDLSGSADSAGLRDSSAGNAFVMLDICLEWSAIIFHRQHRSAMHGTQRPPVMMDLFIVTGGS